MAAHLGSELVKRVIIAIVVHRNALLTPEVLTGRKFIRLNDIKWFRRARVFPQLVRHSEYLIYDQCIAHTPGRTGAQFAVRQFSRKCNLVNLALN